MVKKRLPRTLIAYLVLMVSLLLGMQVSWSRQLPMKVLFDGGKAPLSWNFETTEGVAQQKMNDGIKFTISPWQEGKNMWPRLLLTGPGIDLSEYTNVVVEVQNPTDVAEDIVLGVIAAPKSQVSQTALVPPRSTIKVSVDISDGAPIDQSSVTQIFLYLYRPQTATTYVLKKITAIKNPDYIPVRTALGQRIEQAGRDWKLLEDAAIKQEAITDRLHQTQQLMKTLVQNYQQQMPGYIPLVQKGLLTAQQNISRINMMLRKTNLMIWSSPLGMPIQKGTLPQLNNPILEEINRKVCLNQYEAICVNISTASKPMEVRVELKQPEHQNHIITLRPTLFVKARDGSETADAIGQSCMEIKLNVDAFQSRQIIVWVNTKDKKRHPGDYVASLKISSDQPLHPVRTIPIKIQAVDIHLPSTLPLSITNWAGFYLDRATVTKGLESEALANLRDYGINTWIINYAQMPLPQIDANGKYNGLEKNSLQRFRKVMDLLQGHSNESFVFWLGFQRAKLRSALRQPGLLENYIKDLCSLMDQYHVSVDKRYIQFWDEPKLPQMRESIEWMHKIKMIEPNLKFYDNASSIPLDKKELNDFAFLTDRWMPNWDQLFLTQPQEIETLKSLDIQHLGFYRCLMSRNNRGVNIYEYYRLMSWRLMANGFDTVGFWTYNAGHGEDVWDGTTGAASGGVVIYSKEGKLLSSRRWELFREGLDDYKLAQAAVGTSGVLDAQENSKLSLICKDVIAHLDEPGYAIKIHKKLIMMALQKAKLERRK